MSFSFFSNCIWQISIFTTLLIFTENAFGKAGSHQLQGSWRGTIGKKDVRVCFKNDYPSFYYLEKKQAIILELMPEQKTNKKLLVREGHFSGDPSQISPMWEISFSEKNTITGRRTNAQDKKRSQLIRLEKTAKIIKGVEEFGAHSRDECSTVFYEPLIQASTITSKEKNFSNKAYTEISSKYGTSFLIPNMYPYAEMVNSTNKQFLDAEVVSSYDCDVGLNEWNGSKNSAWFRRHFPIVWTEHWLVTRSAVDNYYCGGAHGDSEQSETIIDLQSQKKVNSWSWIKGGERNANPDQYSPTALQKLLRKYAKRAATKQFGNGAGNGADDFETFFYVTKPYPMSSGMVFTTRLGACRSLDCDVFINIPYKIIAAYLTQEGARVASSLTEQ